MTELRAFVETLPKVELHAHLNGCVREATLFDLANARNIKLSLHHFGSDVESSDAPNLRSVMTRSLSECFDIFVELSRCIDDLEALRRITREALDDFASHYVCYLELRSTPKRLKRQQSKPDVATKQEYVDTILQVFSEFSHEETKRYDQDFQSGVRPIRPALIPKFLVSIDRANTIDEATENVDIAIRMFRSNENDFVVGMDLGGNPTKVSRASI
jgi:adenosine deaminase